MLALQSHDVNYRAIVRHSINSQSPLPDATHDAIMPAFSGSACSMRPTLKHTSRVVLRRPSCQLVKNCDLADLDPAAI